VAVLIAAVVVGVVGTRSSRGDGGPYQVRAIFDDAAFAVPGEQVRIAGAPVGSIQSLDITPKHPGNVAVPIRAAVTIEIDNSSFTPFHADASCSIRPQSLIAERYVDCTPGSAPAPVLPKIQHGPGAGTYYLPVTQTHSPVDTDLLQNISQESTRQQLTVIINELGTGLAARGADLNAVIHRADPALGYTDRVLKILARQNRVLARLATDGDAVLAPLARERQSLSGFVVNANTTAVASAERAAAISQSFKLLPTFLQQLQPLMVDLGQLADQGTPLMQELGQSAAAVNRQFQNLTPFAEAARPATIELGNALSAAQPKLLASTPLADQLNSLGTQAQPAASELNRLTASLDRTGAIEQLMAVLFYGTSAANGFDADGHYVRVQPLVGDCTGYALTPVGGCSANFGGGTGAAAADLGSGGRARAAPAKAAAATAKSKSSSADARPNAAAGTADPAAAKSARTQQTFQGLLSYLIGNRR
jgi:ABC-type transporter Mla subunit MlaD